MKLSDLHKEQLELLLDEPYTAIGASLSSGNPVYLLKAIDSQIKADGLDDFYDLNAKGEQLQMLYEAIYAANEDLLK